MFQPVTEIAIRGSNPSAESCPVCGSQQVWLDGVEQSPQVWLQLAECVRCEHRWTHALPVLAPPTRGVVPVRASQVLEGGARAA